MRGIKIFNPVYEGRFGYWILVVIALAVVVILWFWPSIRWYFAR
jgi:hypothetical protein